ncbi:MAG TPA: hypothetical protein PKA81_01895 [Clostridia bacterium]|nr:hypothetical protein [Clostridia bacterium]
MFQRENSNKKALIEKENPLHQSRNAGAVIGNKKALIEKRNSLRNQSRNGEAASGNKKALIEKEKSFRQSLTFIIKTGKKKRNTGSAEAFLNHFCLHPRAHSFSCLSFRILLILSSI